MDVNDGFGYWLSGYIDGEGSFLAAARQYPDRTDTAVTKHMVVSTRADEYPLLVECQQRTGLGRLYYNKAKVAAVVSKPGWRWVVSNTADCLALIDLLTQYPLRSKKRRDFELWSQFVREHSTWHPGHRTLRNDATKLREIAAELVRCREYDPRYEVSDSEQQKLHSTV